MTKSQKIADLQAKVGMLIEFQKAAIGDDGFVTPPIAKQIATQTFLEQQAALEKLRDEVTKLLNAVCALDTSGVLRHKLNLALQ